MAAYFECVQSTVHRWEKHGVTRGPARKALDRLADDVNAGIVTPENCHQPESSAPREAASLPAG